MDVSSISNYDYATIKATWYHHTSPEFQCKQAEEILSRRKDAELVIQNRRKEKGCGVFSDEVKVEIDGISFYSCLCHPEYQNPHLHTYMAMSDALKSGVTPEVGGYLDQASKTMEIIELIESLRQEHQQKMQEERNKNG